MYDYHFDAKSQELNSSGVQHLQWILQSAPNEHRQIFVQSVNDAIVNQSRVANVQLAATNLVGADAITPVALRVAHPAGRPAEEVEWIFEQQQQIRVPPKIEYIAPASKAK